MTTVSMGASVMSAVVALGALAYALTLEAKILTNDARSSSTCSAVSLLSYLLVYMQCFQFHSLKILSFFSSILSQVPPFQVFQVLQHLIVPGKKLFLLLLILDYLLSCFNTFCYFDFIFRSTTDSDQTEANLVACINVAVSDINTKLVTAINNYGNPTC